MVKKSFIFLLMLFMPIIKADRLDDAVRASNYDEVNYLLVMRGNTLSQHRKDELVLLANEMTQRAKRKRYPFGTLWDSYVTAKGLAAAAIAGLCVRRLYNVGLPQPHYGEFKFIYNGLQYYFFGIGGLTAAGYGIYWLIDGLRCAHGRSLYNQAVEIEKRINELKVTES